MTLKKYPDNSENLIGRVLIKQDDMFWHLLSIDESKKLHWLRVVEKFDGQRKYFVGFAPHQTQVSDDILPGERVFFPSATRR